MKCNELPNDLTEKQILDVSKINNTDTENYINFLKDLVMEYENTRSNGFSKNLSNLVVDTETENTKIPNKNQNFEVYYQGEKYTFNFVDYEGVIFSDKVLINGVDVVKLFPVDNLWRSNNTNSIKANEFTWNKFYKFISDVSKNYVDIKDIDDQILKSFVDKFLELLNVYKNKQNKDTTEYEKFINALKRYSK